MICSILRFGQVKKFCNKVWGQNPSTVNTSQVAKLVSTENIWKRLIVFTQVICLILNFVLWNVKMWQNQRTEGTRGQKFPSWHTVTRNTSGKKPSLPSTGYPKKSIWLLGVYWADILIGNQSDSIQKMSIGLYRPASKISDRSTPLQQHFVSQTLWFKDQFFSYILLLTIVFCLRNWFCFVCLFFCFWSSFS